MSDSEIETSWGNRTLSVIGGVGFILLFLLILWLAYLPYRPEPISEVLAETRLQNLQEIRNASAEVIDSYGVVNPNEGIYRIPVEEAMRLTVEQYRTSSSEKESE
ncbi:hypothetical protein [Puniceicoccus vermicola]|uniref:Uncharacterized protein n=1 Tax=Puniceicoccus vermicola TaxID=388746 RepID=A0A7X1B036_9BACT|nr:hypothetical protein [Puniceicoccus vermicola]MBC2603092.1 hypothetical protein [Puniceicoccus vermicola]